MPKKLFYLDNGSRCFEIGTFFNCAATALLDGRDDAVVRFMHQSAEYTRKDGLFGPVHRHDQRIICFTWVAALSTLKKSERVMHLDSAEDVPLLRGIIAQAVSASGLKNRTRDHLTDLLRTRSRQHLGLIAG